MFDAKDYAVIAKFLMEKSGLEIGMEKAYLLKTRLEPLLKKFEQKDISELIQTVTSGKNKDLERAVIDSMMTNETYFFRDSKPFEQLKDYIVPNIEKVKVSSKTIRVWSSASSTGQEAYSVAMLLDHIGMQKKGWKIEILATDLSQKALTQARSGTYNNFEIQRGLSQELINKYFKQEDKGWKIREDIAKMVKFEEFNLMHAFAGLGKFDVIFCRNVLIYFDAPTKKRILENMAMCLEPEGYLILGGAETTFGITDKYTRVEKLQTAIYQRSQKL